MISDIAAHSDYMNQSSFLQSHIPYQSSPDRHLKSLIQKLEDILLEFQKKYPSFSKRAKYDFKQKFEQFASYLAIYYSHKMDMSEEQSQVFKKFVIQQYVLFPDIEHLQMPIVGIINSNNTSGNSVNTQNAQRRSHEIQSGNVFSEKRQNTFANSGYSSPIKVQSRRTPSTSRKNTTTNPIHFKSFQQNSNIDRSQLFQQQRPTKNYQEELFISKLQVILLNLKENNQSPPITEQFSQSRKILKKVQQLNLLKSSPYAETVQNFQIKSETQSQSEGSNNFCMSHDSPQYFNGNKINQQNSEYIDQYNDRNDIIYLIYYPETISSTVVQQEGKHQVSKQVEHVYQKLKVQFATNFRQAIEKDVMKLKEFQILKVLGGHQTDEQEFQDFININLLNLKVGSDLVFNSENDGSFFYSPDILHFVEEWFKIQIESNKLTMCKTYKLIRIEEHQKQIEENNKLQAIIQQRDNEIVNLKQMLEQRNAKIQQLENIVENQKNEISDLNSEILEKDQIILGKDDEIESKQQEIVSLQAQNDVKEEEINSLREVYGKRDAECNEIKEKYRDLEQQFEQYRQDQLNKQNSINEQQDTEVRSEKSQQSKQQSLNENDDLQQGDSQSDIGVIE